MLLKIAWRNIWRNRTRSLVVIGAIIIGVWSVIFLISYSVGTIKSYVNNAIENEISHLQIHHPDFPKDKEIKYYLPHAEAMEAELQATDHVQAATVRSLTNAMLSTAKGARGIQIKGIQPQTEAQVTHLDQKLVEGEYFGSSGRNPILISRTLADKLGVKLRSKVVLTFQDLNGDITAAAFRIVGLFETNSNAVDEGTAFTLQSDLNQLLGAEQIAHEAAILLHDPDFLEQVDTTLRQRYPDLLVQTYKELSPEIELFNSQIQLTATIFTVIVMLALIFGIINTMLMAVLERLKELGMLMAIGMNKFRVFFMIVLETILLGLLATPLGLLAGYLTVVRLSEIGIDLSAWSGGMREFGISEIIYPSLESQIYGQLALAVFITAVVASLYPAYKAIRLKPVEALHKI